MRFLKGTLAGPDRFRLGAFYLHERSNAMVDTRYYFRVFGEEDLTSDDDTTIYDTIGFYSYDESILRETGINVINDKKEDE
jgi:hypothetical protein